MLCKDNLLKLNQFAAIFSSEYLKKEYSVGWFEDERQEGIYSERCPKGNFSLTKGLRKENKALSDTCFVVIKFDGEYKAMEVRFHDDSVIEILSDQCGYAKYKINGKNNKYITLRTPICPTINSCIFEYNEQQKKKNHRAVNFINAISKICIENNVIKKNDNNNLCFINDLQISIRKWCELFEEFKYEQNIISEIFYSNAGLPLNHKTIKVYLKNERKNIITDIYSANVRKIEFEQSKKNNNKLKYFERLLTRGREVEIKKLNIKMQREYFLFKTQYEKIVNIVYSFPKYRIKGEQIEIIK